MPTLQDAIRLATEAHTGQFERSGLPYITHPMHLMLQMSTEVERMVAILHDVVEDTSVTLGELVQADYPPEVVAAVDCLTRRENEPYEASIERVKTDPIAIKVKIADLEHNMDIRRLGQLLPEDFDRLQRYHKAWKSLKEIA